MIEEDIVRLINHPNTFIGKASIDVDNCQWIKAISGISDPYFDKINLDKPEYAVYIRDVSNQAASLRTQEIYKRLRNCDITIIRLPTYVGEDDKHRNIYSFHIQYQIGG